MACTIDANNFFAFFKYLYFAPLLFIRLNFSNLATIFVLELELRDPVAVACAPDLANSSEVHINTLKVLFGLNLGQEQRGHLAVGHDQLNATHDSVNLVALFPVDSDSFHWLVRRHGQDVLRSWPLIVRLVSSIVVVAEDWNLS
jgi:hypothetical protein